MNPPPLQDETNLARREPTAEISAVDASSDLVLPCLRYRSLSQFARMGKRSETGAATHLKLSLVALE